MDPEPLGIIDGVTRAFEQAGIPYPIGGSIAGSVYGITRATHDVDFVADIRMDQVPALVAALQDRYLVEPEAIVGAVERRDVFNILDKETMYKADIFLIKRTRFAESEWARRRIARLEFEKGSADVTVCSPEDTILQKLEWYRMGGGVSDRQWNDVLGILKIQAAALDYQYLLQWAAELRLTDLLDKARGDAGVVEPN